jgi:hypothetical protein
MEINSLLSLTMEASLSASNLVIRSSVFIFIGSYSLSTFTESTSAAFHLSSVYGALPFVAIAFAAFAFFFSVYMRSSATAYKPLTTDVDSSAKEESQMEQLKEYGSTRDCYQISYGFEPKAHMKTIIEIANKI